MLSAHIDQYLIAALWSTTGSEVENLDDKYSIEDISDEFISKSETELDEFWEKSKHLFTEEELKRKSDIAHCFWLNRHGHGSGFWDGDYANGDALSEICKTFPDVQDKLREAVGDDKDNDEDAA